MASALNGSTRACPGHGSFQPARPGSALRGGDLEVGGGGTLGLRVFLEDRENKAGADDGQEPDELRLPDLLLALVEAALEDAHREPCLEGHEGEQGDGDQDLEEVHRADNVATRGFFASCSSRAAAFGAES